MEVWRLILQNRLQWLLYSLCSVCIFPTLNCTFFTYFLSLYFETLSIFPPQLLSSILPVAFLFPLLCWQSELPTAGQARASSAQALATEWQELLSTHWNKSNQIILIRFIESKVQQKQIYMLVQCLGKGMLRLEPATEPKVAAGPCSEPAPCTALCSLLMLTQLWVFSSSRASSQWRGKYIKQRLSRWTWCGRSRMLLFGAASTLFWAQQAQAGSGVWGDRTKLNMGKKLLLPQKTNHPLLMAWPPRSGFGSGSGRVFGVC